MTQKWRVGLDVGGTFTDVVASLPSTGDVRIAKVRTRPDDPVSGLKAAMDGLSLSWDELGDLVLSSTMVTNMIVEGRIAEVALIASEGFGDTIEIGRQNRLHLYRLDLQPKVTPLVPRELRFEVRERVEASGRIVIGLPDEEIDALAEKLREANVSAVAIALLHSYANPEHELRIAQRLRGTVPHIAMSHEVNPEAREYERTATTVLSAGVLALVGDYIDRMEAAKPSNSRLHLFHSAGGMAGPEVIRRLPLGLALSGPAAGVTAAARIAAEQSIDRALCFDMGGTTSDVCLIVDGVPEIRTDRSLCDRPLRQPMVAVESIGAGGSSIARLEAGLMRVGPQSAGADPGPACYGLGGRAATVSDADLLLGYLEAGRNFGDGLKLDRAAAEAAFRPLAAATESSIIQAAFGVTRIAHAAMARAIQRVTVDRGVDARDCVLIAYGGAGPMHAAELARILAIRRVIVPHFSSVFSALGCLSADMSYSQQQTVQMASSHWSGDGICQLHSDLTAQVAASLLLSGDDQDRLRTATVAGVRYSGQSYALEVSEPILNDAAALGEQFRNLHEGLYGFATEEPWELTFLRVRAWLPSAAAPMASAPSDGTVTLGETECWFEGGGPIVTPRRRRDQLRPGDRLLGPAIVEDDWSTTVLPPGDVLTVDRQGHLTIEVEAAQ